VVEALRRYIAETRMWALRVVAGAREKGDPRPTGYQALTEAWATIPVRALFPSVRAACYCSPGRSPYFSDTT
jgi:hypothetical protein